MRQFCDLLRAKGQQGHISESFLVLLGHEWQKASKSHFIQLVAARIQLSVCSDCCTVRLELKTYYYSCCYVFDRGLSACYFLFRWTARC